MEIHNNYVNGNTVRRVKKNIKKRWITVILLLFFGFLGFGLSCLYYGAYLHKTGQTPLLKMFVVRLKELNFSFISQHFEAKLTDIDNFSIDVKFKNWEKIRYFREKALIHGSIKNEFQEKVPAKIRYGSHVYRVDIGLTGQTGSHFNHPDKWSISIKVKDGRTIMGMKKFALLVPFARGYLTDWIATEILKSENVIGIRCNFVNVTVNGENKGLYYLEERFDNRLIENNRFREGLIFKLGNNREQSGLKFYGLKRIKENKEQMLQYIRLKQLIQSFLSGEIQADKVFDLKKFACLFVVSDIVNEKHAIFRSNMRMYFNPITSLIEPIGREWGYLRKEMDNTNLALSIGKPDPNVKFHEQLHEDPILSKIFSSLAFKELYIEQADILSKPTYLDQILKAKRQEIDLLMKKVHMHNPFYQFPSELLYKNQEYIQKKLNPILPAINVFFNKIEGNKVLLHVENKIDLPIEIHYFKYNDQEIVPLKRLFIKSNYTAKNIYQDILLQLNNDIDLSSFSPHSVVVYYSILGMKELKQVVVFPKKMTKKDFADLNITKKVPDISEFDFLKIKVKGETIEFADKNCEIQKDLIIPPGYKVIAKPGTRINITNSARIISYSPILFFGSTDNPITITSTDSTGQGIVILNSDQVSELDYVNFEYLSNISDFGWDLKGAITFFESPVNIKHCTFRNNLRGDDYVNIIRTEFSIQDTLFEDTKADAFDADFSVGTIKNVKFYHIGNDAIDISGTKLNLVGVDILNADYKGISGGEGSYLIGNNIKVNGGGIAVASKDNTNMEINGINIVSSKLAYCAFQKKSEYGPGKIIAKNSTVKDVETKYLVEVGSSLSINGKQIDKKSKKIEEVLYGKKYGKSSK